MGSSWCARLLLVLVVVGAPAEAKLDLAKIDPETLDECQALVRRFPEDPAAYRCFGYVARRHRLSEQAIAKLTAIVNNESRNPHALLALATLESTRGDRRAEGHYLAAAESYERSRDYGQGIFTLTSLFFFHARRGEFERASEALSRASVLARASGEEPLQLRVRYHEGLAAWYARDYGLAYSIYSEVERRVFPGEVPPDTYLQTLVQNGLGQVAWAMGRRRESYDRFLRAAEIEHSTSDLVDEAGYRLNLAILAIERGKKGELDPAEVRTRLQEALQIAIRAPNPGAESSVRLLLAAEGERSLPERLDDATRALELAKQLHLVDKIGAALRQLAELHEGPPSTNHQKGRALLDEAQRLAERSANRREIYQTHVARARWYERGGNTASAIDELRTAVGVAEQLRALQPEAATQARVFAQYSPAYLRLAALLGATRDVEGVAGAFDVIERWRAGVLLAALEAARIAPSPPADSPDRQQRERLLERIAEVQRVLVNQDLDEKERDDRLSNLRALEQEEHVLRDRLARTDRHPSEHVSPKPPSLRQIQAALTPRQAMVSYVFPEATDDGLTWPGLAFVISSHHSAMVELPPQGTIARQASLYLGLLRGRDAAEPSASVGLYRSLIAPVLQQLPADVDQLIIVPDAPLHRLPLAALRPRPDDLPLLSRYSLSFASSAATWAIQSTGVKPPLEFLSLADPAFERASVQNSKERGAVFGGTIRLGRLRAARREARALANALGSGESFTGEAASEHRLKTIDLSRFGVLHLAAHAIVDEVEPVRSAVLLAPGEEHEDGLLQPREIAILRLSGAVVVLSACQTATGEAVAGEGVLGLSRAFFEAGARSVVASLWPLRDEEAADLTAAFSEGLARGESVASALAGAERDSFQRGHPAAAWAGFIVLGHGDLIPFPGGVPHSGWTAALRISLLMAGVSVVISIVSQVRRRGNRNED